MRKWMLLSITALLLCSVIPVFAGEDLDISAASAIVLEPYTGTVLYEKQADERRLIASTTKIMTAMVVLEHCGLDEIVIPTEEHAGVEGSSMQLVPGESYTVEEMLYGLLLASGNDAGAALADHCAGSMEAFAAMMNKKAEELGLQNTHFENAHGLDAPEHYSTARELALITAAAMENDVFSRIFSTVSYTVRDITYENHNQLLTVCPGCIGGKTGYTKAAGRILVSAAEREGMRLICVTITDPDDWADHMALYDALYARWRYMTLPQEQWKSVETLSGTKSFVRIICDTAALVVPKDDLTVRVRLPRFVFAPITTGETAGSVEITVAGAPAYTARLYYGETVALERAMALSGWERFRKLWFFSGGTGIYYLDQ